MRLVAFLSSFSPCQLLFIFQSPKAAASHILSKFYSSTQWERQSGGCFLLHLNQNQKQRRVFLNCCNGRGEKQDMGKESQFYGGKKVKCSKNNSVTLFFLVNPCILENNFTLQTFQKLFNVLLYFPSSSKRKYSYACVCVHVCAICTSTVKKTEKHIQMPCQKSFVQDFCLFAPGSRNVFYLFVFLFVRFELNVTSARQ